MNSNMKQICKYGAALTLVLTVAACSSELTEPTLPQAGAEGKLITVTATQYSATQRTQAEQPQTRTNHLIAEDRGDVTVTWADKDKFYVGAKWPEGSTFGAIPSDKFKTFELTSGSGSQDGIFQGEPPTEVNVGDDLYAVYGKTDQMKYFDAMNQGQYIKGVTFSYEDQRQIINDDKAHLSDYDFMIAKEKYKEGTTPNFNFQHIGALMKFTLTLPTSGLKVKELLLAAASGTPFVSSLKWQTDESLIPQCRYSTSRRILSLGKKGYSLELEGQTLTAYMMVAPTIVADNPIAGKEIMLIVTDEEGNPYIAKLTGAAIEPGRYYTVNAELKAPFTGNGKDQPYEINDAGQLRDMAILVAYTIEDRNFKLTNDIDLKDEPWTPINGFNGSFSGLKGDNENYSISNLKIEGTLAMNHLGLFADLGTATTAKISHVTVSGEINATVNKMESNNFVEIGGIVGRMYGGTIEHCTSTCTINATAGDEIKRICAGGIVGYISYTGALVNCTNTADISLKAGAITEELYTGAIIGQAEVKTITVNGYANTGTPKAIIGYYQFKNYPQDSKLSINETLNGTPIVITSGSGSYYPPIDGGAGEYKNEGGLFD